MVLGFRVVLMVESCRLWGFGFRGFTVEGRV